MKIALAVIAALMLAHIADAVTVNPTSNVLGDSAATAGALVFRDSSALFAIPQLSTGAISILSEPAGTAVWAIENIAGTPAANAWNLCVSTTSNVSSFVYVVISTGLLNSPVVGQACTK